MYLRGRTDGISFPGQVTVNPATPEDMAEIEADIAEYCTPFRS